MLELFGPWKTNCEKYGLEDGWFDELFDENLLDLDPRASAGLGPLAYYGGTVGDALGYDELSGYDPDRIRIFREITRARLYTPSEPDPILVFVKQEPCKRAKAEASKWRIISAVGLVDTMVDRIMLGWLARATLSHVGHTPVMIGWSPYKGGFRYIARRFGNSSVLCADKSSWDWSVQGWLLHLVKDLIHGLALQAPDFWHEWLEARWRALFCDAVFGFRSGLRVRQSGWGVMKSGCYLTIWINSVCQCILHYLACMRLNLEPDWVGFVCMGDDTAQSPPPDVDAYLGVLRSLGAIIKEAVIRRDVEFCGHVITRDSVVPAYKLKHLFKMAFAPNDVLPQVLSSYQMAYAMDLDSWGMFTSLLARVAPQYSRTWGECLKLVKG